MLSRYGFWSGEWFDKTEFYLEKLIIGRICMLRSTIINKSLLPWAKHLFPSISKMKKSTDDIFYLYFFRCADTGKEEQIRAHQVTWTLIYLARHTKKYQNKVIFINIHTFPSHIKQWNFCFIVKYAVRKSLLYSPLLCCLISASKSTKSNKYFSTLYFIFAG